MTAFGATVLEHFRRPRNQRRLAAPSGAHEAYNPLCGDRVLLEVAVEGPTIREAAFTANACALCTASASLLTEHVTGMRVADALRIAEETVISSLNSDVPDGRRACATLPLTAMRRALAAVTPVP